MVPPGVTDRGQYYAIGLGVALGTLLWSIFNPDPDNMIVYWLGLAVADLIGIGVCTLLLRMYRDYHRNPPAA